MVLTCMSIVLGSMAISIKQLALFVVVVMAASAVAVTPDASEAASTEDGFEFVIKNEYALMLWEELIEAGKEYGLKPIGLGARDTLRLEAALMLYGNDLTDKTTPVEAGLKWSLSVDKTQNYHGKEVIVNQIKNGADKKLIGFVMTERAIPRHEYEIYFDGHKTGFVSSGGYSPTLDKNIGMGYVDTKDNITLDATIEIMVRNKLYKAKVVKRPFVTKKYKIS